MAAKQVSNDASLGPLVRFLLWGYERGSLAYDILCVLVFLLVLLAPPAWLADPMLVRP